MKNPAEKRILIVDDENEMRVALNAALKRGGYDLTTAEDGRQAWDILQDQRFDLVISDVRMPGMNGLDLLKNIKQQEHPTSVLMMTAYGDIDNAVETMKAGAFDYLLKPFSAEILESAVNRALQDAKDPPPTANKPAQEVEGVRREDREIVTQNKEMRKLLAFVEKIAYSKSTVLISGETGTGKEMFARFIHQNSPRAERPFLAVNCAALPEGLLETEMFGHEKGAFTGATTRKDGKFELAHKGTLLLDEVTEMTLPLQAKLLRVLQEHEIDKVGGREPIPVDVRIIATTNCDVKQLVQEKKFREDLYYRLNVIPLALPPLRDRKEDIPFLCDYFLKRHSKREKKNVAGISDSTLSFLKNYTWRGNVRELENVMERAVLICQSDTLEPSDLLMDDSPPTTESGTTPNATPFRGTISEMEKELILQTLEEFQGNKTKAAERLGISIRTLRNKLNEYGS